jgi:UDP-2,3-diacylglucosamine hydrolase
LEGQRTYFASDFHLGLAAETDPREREARVTAWLEEASHDARSFYLLGDIFDFWWEYNKVVPRGFTRFLGTLSSLTDRGIDIHIFTGNHDMWMKNYLVDECGVTIHHEPLLTQIGDDLFYLAHGEGLGSTSIGTRLLFAFFHNRFAQVLFSALHPRIGMALGHAWSKRSRLAKHVSLPFLGEDREDLIRHTRTLAAGGCQAQYYIYGHRHLPLTFDEEGRRMIILGDWFSCLVSYAVYDGKELVLVSETLDP